MLSSAGPGQTTSRPGSVVWQVTEPPPRSELLASPLATPRGSAAQHKTRRQHQAEASDGLLPPQPLPPPPPGDSRTLINHLSVPGVRAHVLFANYTDAACLRRVAPRRPCSRSPAM